LHLAAHNSFVEAIKILIEKHKYDLNILVNEKSFLIDLLENPGLKDFSILNSIFKNSEVCINSGARLPLN